MKIKFFNFLTRKEQIFKPIHKRKAFIYACGPTVYDYVHIGNLRTFLFYDFLRRGLEYLGYKVKLVINITDIDDKIIKKANEEKISWQKVSQKYKKEFFKDLKDLNIKKAFVFPEASKHIKEIIKTIQLIEKNGFAYKTKDGVYFDVSKYPYYGVLVDLKKQKTTKSRILADDYTKDQAADFALWKFKKPKEPFWQSPWGEGRPGWHIECSAMSVKYLGIPFDIHCGGVDLVFPHHENEIAQSKAALKKDLAKFFIEGEHLMVNNQKMSKRFKNFFTLKDLKKKNYHPLAFRYLMLSSHYQTKANFTFKALKASQNALFSLWQEFSSLLLNSNNKKPEQTIIKKYEKEFQKTLADNLNTPLAISLLNNFLKDSKVSNKDKEKLVLKWDNFFGLDFAKIKKYIQKNKIKIKTAKKLLKERQKAREKKEWQKADKIREQIRKLGFVVEDLPEGAKIKLCFEKLWI